MLSKVSSPSHQICHGLLSLYSGFGWTQTISTVNGGSKTANYWGCTSTYPIDATPTTVFAFKDGFTSSYNGTMTGFTAITGPVLMWAQVITVAFQPGDLSLFTTSMSTSAASSTASDTITSPPTITPTSSTNSPVVPQTQSASPEPASPALSIGAIAGIAIGSVAVLCLLAGLIAFIWFKRSSSRRKAADHATALSYAGMATTRPHPHHDTPSTMDPYDRSYPYEKSAPRYGANQLGELDARNDRRYELSDMRD